MCLLMVTLAVLAQGKRLFGVVCFVAFEVVYGCLIFVLRSFYI